MGYRVAQTASRESVVTVVSRQSVACDGRTGWRETGESYAVWSFLLSCVAGEVGWKSAGLGACGIVEGGQGFVTETCRVHKFVSVVFWVLGSVEMSCNCLSFSNNEYLSESWCSSYAAASVYLGVVATTRCDRSPARITQSC
jgi:hypothetical protein